MSYRKHLNDKFYRNEIVEFKSQITFTFYSPKRVYIISKLWTFFLILLSYYSIH